MNRRIHVGGTSTRSSRGAAAEPRRRHEKIERDAVDPGSIDWEHVRPLRVDLDPVLLEEIRGRRLLRQMTLRVGIEQIEEARRVAARTGQPYQAVLRRWLAEGASIARTTRLRSRKRPKQAKRG